MLKHRVIPCLLLHGDGLVKTVRFRNPVYVGDPINAIRIFNEKEVDELMVLDIEASPEGREPNYALIEKFAGECCMPLCYGGGVRTVDQARRLFALGVEKVSLQSAALKDMTILKDMSTVFGSQSVLFSLDVRSGIFGRKICHSSSTRRDDPRTWRAVLQLAVENGAGEIVLNSIERDGTMSGMDLDLIRQVSAGLSVPLIAIGGVGSMEHILQAIRAGASGVAAGSFFVFDGPRRAVFITYPRYAELEALLAGEGSSRFDNS